MMWNVLMKKIVYIIAIMLLVSDYYVKMHANNLFSLSATTTWREYPLITPQITFQKEKWAWTSSLVIKSKQPMKLTNLVLQWHGNKMPQLFASLYQKKEREPSVVPIQKNLVCDGVWDVKKQQLSFTLNEKIVAINKYHLVLSYPKHIEHMIKKGKFAVISTEVKAIDNKLPANQKAQLFVHNHS